MAQKLRIGDVFEIKTPAGFAYVQYTHEGRDMGELVRVLPGLYSSRPDLKQLTREKELYFTFYTLKYALRAGQVKFVSNEPVPNGARCYPPMRVARGSDRSGKILNWLITDASKELTLDEIPKMLNVTELTPEQEKFSLYQLWGHQGMVQRLESGWTPEHAEEFRLKEVAAAEAREKAKAESPQELKAQFLDHYLYFPKKSHARIAGQRLRAKGWAVEVRKGGDGKNWLALAKQPVPIEDDIGDIRDELEALAAELGGEYDGWGAPV